MLIRVAMMMTFSQVKIIFKPKFTSEISFLFSQDTAKIIESLKINH